MKQFVTIIICLLTLSPHLVASEFTITFTVTPSDAKITINGQYYGTGTATINMEQAGKVLATFEREGYITLTKKYHYNFKYGYSGGSETYNKGSNHFSISLQKDDKHIPAEAISSSSDSINTFYSCVVSPKHNAETAWKATENVVLDYFEEVNFKKVEQGNLKTPWVAAVAGSKKIRTRLIVRVETEQPLTYRFNLQSEYCNDVNAYEYDDYRFQKWDLVMNKYRGLIQDLMGKLK
jgi:hypothetical protein